MLTTKREIRQFTLIGLTLAMIFCGLFLTTNTVSAATSGYYTYTSTGSGVMITDYKGPGGVVNIPKTLGERQ